MYFYALVAAAAVCYFAVEALRRPRPGVIVAAIVWLLYAGYEVLIGNGTLCDANCNIRVDLILLWPLIWIASLFGIYAPGQWPSAAKVFAKVSLAFLAAMVALSLYIALVETPAANRAAQQQNCAGPNESDCPPAAPPSDSTPGAK